MNCSRVGLTLELTEPMAARSTDAVGTLPSTSHTASESTRLKGSRTLPTPVSSSPENAKATKSMRNIGTRSRGQIPYVALQTSETRKGKKVMRDTSGAQGHFEQDELEEEDYDISHDLIGKLLAIFTPHI